MTNPTRRYSRSLSHLFSVTHVDATLCRWATARGYELPVIELVGEGCPGETLLRVRDDAGIERSLLFVLSSCGLRVSDFSVAHEDAVVIDAEVLALFRRSGRS